MATTILKRPRVIRNEYGKSYEDGVLECGCGRAHHYGWGDSQCSCGANYNACGQRLTDDAHRIPEWCDSEDQIEAWRCSQEEG